MILDNYMFELNAHIMSRMTPRIYLSGEVAAVDTKLLLSNNIKYVLRVNDYMASAMSRELYADNDIVLIHIPMDDCPEFNIKKFFDITCNIIDTCLQNTTGTILINCTAGISRSATILAAHLIKKNTDISVADIVRDMQRARDCIDPNRGFMHQLEEFSGQCQREYQCRHQ